MAEAIYDDFHAIKCVGAASVTAASFREAMRHLPGGVSVITVGRGEDRTGLTATSGFLALPGSAHDPRLHQPQLFELSGPP
jgi:hypothetical protein